LGGDLIGRAAVAGGPGEGLPGLGLHAAAHKAHRLFEQAPVVFNLGAELLRVGPPVREAVDAGSPVAARAVVAGPAGDLAEEVADLVLDDRAEPAAEAQGRIVLAALHPLTPTSSRGGPRGWGPLGGISRAWVSGGPPRRHQARIGGAYWS